MISLSAIFDRLMITFVNTQRVNIKQMSELILPDIW